MSESVNEQGGFEEVDYGSKKLGSLYDDPSFFLDVNLAFELIHNDLSRPLTPVLAENFCRIIGNLVRDIHLFVTGTTMMLAEEVVLQIFV